MFSGAPGQYQPPRIIPTPPPPSSTTHFTITVSEKQASFCNGLIRRRETPSGLCLYLQQVHGATLICVADHLCGDQIGVGSGDGGDPGLDLWSQDNGSTQTVK